MAICVGMSSGCLLYFIVAINKKVPPWYAVLTGSVVDSDDAKIDIFVQMWGKKYRFGQKRLFDPNLFPIFAPASTDTRISCWRYMKYNRPLDMNALDNANIKDENSSGFASFAFPEAKSSKTGVSVRYVPCEDKAWYVLRIKYGQAQTVADALIEDGTYVYLAKIW